MTSSSPPIPDAQREATMKAVRASYDFWNTGDEALLKEAIAPNFTDHTLPPGRPQGPQGPVFASRQFRAAVPDLKVTVGESHPRRALSIRDLHTRTILRAWGFICPEWGLIHCCTSAITDLGTIARRAGAKPAAIHTQAIAQKNIVASMNFLEVLIGIIWPLMYVRFSIVLPISRG
jgi:hypothetical protein